MRRRVKRVSSFDNLELGLGLDRLFCLYVWMEGGRLFARCLPWVFSCRY